ncbi:MAG: hypothetical protein ACJ762_04825 [Solirubrobacteraceae bacterium]
MSPRRALLVPLAFIVLLPGCGTSDDRRQARAAVERFYDAVRHDRGADACAELSLEAADQLESQTGQQCGEVVTRLDYEGGAVVRTQVFATNAKVDLRSGESAFLSRESDGWRLSAIACDAKEKPRDRPFDCEVEG